MKTDKPSHGSGKTHFNRIKTKGQSWTALRSVSPHDDSWKHRENVLDKYDDKVVACRHDE